MDYINRGNKPGKTGFGLGLLSAAESDNRIICLGADITASVGCDLFAQAFPGRFFSLGIAEQNCAGVAAGMALEGLIPVFSTYGVFAACRAADQIRVSICYNNLPVIIGGAHAGVSVGPDGATHQALEDIAFMRALPNMTVISPCDATQTALATREACINGSGPVYIRFGREAMPDFSPETDTFTIGLAQQLTSGDDLSIIATGHMVWEALKAAGELADRGIHARVINVHTIKPIDKECIIRAAMETGAIVTAEEHQIFGGLGGTVAEILIQECPVPMAIVGMPDRFGESGQPLELMEKFGLCSTEIVRESLAVLHRK